ncbi:MAG: YlbF family regulator, partial [Akkermansia sp.]
MKKTSLSPELVELAQQLSAAFATSQQVTSAKARIGLFYQNQEATDMFRKVQECGEGLREKQMSGMSPSEDEIAQFDEMRQAVVSNELCTGFLESRQQIEELLGTVNQYLCLAIDLGRSPSDEEVANAMQQQMQAGSGGCGCGCSSEGSGNCEGC